MTESSLPSSPISAWLLAARLFTLPASVVPVLVGSAVAAVQGAFSPLLFVLTLAGSILVQVGANLTDEFADHAAAESALKYPAPHKVITRGLLSVRQVQVGAALTFALATVIGSYLVWRSGWPLLAVCLIAVACAYGYSAGPLPLGDIALGEVTVFVLMGPVMVMSTVYVQTQTWELTALWYSLPVGALVTAILMANNLRDAAEDSRSGRRTLVTLLGVAPVRAAYAGLILLALLAAPLSWLQGGRSPWLLLPLVAVSLAVQVLRMQYRSPDADTLNLALKTTAKLHAAYGVLLAAGLLLADRMG